MRYIVNRLMNFVIRSAYCNEIIIHAKDIHLDMTPPAIGWLALPCGINLIAGLYAKKGVLGNFAKLHTLGLSGIQHKIELPQGVQNTQKSILVCGVSLYLLYWCFVWCSSTGETLHMDVIVLWAIHCKMKPCI